MRFSTLFFDLGSTLIYSKALWPPIFQQAGQIIFSSLQKAGLDFSLASPPLALDGFLDAYYLDRGSSTVEKTASTFLRELLLSHGLPQVPDALLRQALNDCYAHTQTNWYLEEDALPMLVNLRQQGYALALISNTSDDANVQQLLDLHHLRPFFQYILTSAGCSIRKPDPRIFQMALDHFGIQPDESVMVGDTLSADILGANQLGIYSIWITRRAPSIADGDLPIQPQAIISTLAQLPPLLADLATLP